MCLIRVSACTVITFLALSCCADEYDVRSSDVAQKILDVLPKIGNEGKKRIDRLIVDDVNLTVSGTATVLARHKWGTVPAPTWANPNRRVDVAAEKEVQFEFRYDMKTNELDGDASLGTIKLGALNRSADYEVKVDIDLVRETMEGNLWKLVELIPNPAPSVLRRESENEYKKIRDSKLALHGHENVYFASRDFVNWASPERLGEWAVEGVLTSGASISNAMQQVQAKALDELPQLLAFFNSVGINAPQDKARAILSGDKVTGFGSLAVKWQTVAYRTRVFVLNQPGPWVSIRHAAFYVVYTGPGGSDQVPNDQPDPNDPNAPPVIRDADFPEDRPRQRDESESRQVHRERYSMLQQSENTRWEFGARVKYRANGVEVMSIQSGSPAAQAGLTSGDWILEVDSSPIGVIGNRVYGASHALAKAGSQDVQFTIARIESTTWVYYYPMVRLRIRTADVTWERTPAGEIRESF